MCKATDGASALHHPDSEFVCSGPQPDSCTAAKIKIARVGPNVVPKQLHRVDDFICGHNGTGVVRDIDVESGVHLLIRVIRRGVFCRRDLVAELTLYLGLGLSARRTTIGSKTCATALKCSARSAACLRCGAGARPGRCASRLRPRNPAHR